MALFVLYEMYIIPGMDGVGLTKFVGRENSRYSLYWFDSVYSIFEFLVSTKKVTAQSAAIITRFSWPSPIQLDVYALTGDVHWLSFQWRSEIPDNFPRKDSAAKLIHGSLPSLAPSAQPANHFNTLMVGFTVSAFKHSILRSLRALSQRQLFNGMPIACNHASQWATFTSLP